MVIIVWLDGLIFTALVLTWIFLHLISEKNLKSNTFLLLKFDIIRNLCLNYSNFFLTDQLRDKKWNLRNKAKNKFRLKDLNTSIPPTSHQIKVVIESEDWKMISVCPQLSIFPPYNADITPHHPELLTVIDIIKMDGWLLADITFTKFLNIREVFI